MHVFLCLSLSLSIALSFSLFLFIRDALQQRIVYAKSNTAQCNCHNSCKHRATKKKKKKLINASASFSSVVIYTVLISSFVQLIIALSTHTILASLRLIASNQLISDVYTKWNELSMWCDLMWCVCALRIKQLIAVVTWYYLVNSIYTNPLRIRSISSSSLTNTNNNSNIKRKDHFEWDWEEKRVIRIIGAIVNHVRAWPHAHPLTVLFESIDNG